MEKPKFTHDSKCCVFLGHHEGHDLYVCPQNSRPTVIARYSDKVGDYKSGMSIANLDPHLGEAKKRALEQGYLQEDYRATDFLDALSDAQIEEPVLTTNKE